MVRVPLQRCTHNDILVAAAKVSLTFHVLLKHSLALQKLTHALSF